MNYVQRIVNEHGSIFHPVHQENDLGVDGLIELVHAEESTARLVAVQIKSGDSYFPNAQGDFVMRVDQPHLDYWLRFPVPVLVIGHSSGRDTALWVSVADYVQMERNFYREPVQQIRIPAHCRFDAQALSAGVTSVAVGSDARLVLKGISMCLSDDAQERFEGLRMLAVLSESRHHTITCLLAHRLIMDEDIKTAKAAVLLFGFFAAFNLRLWATVGPEQLQQCQLAFKLCEGLTEGEISRILKFYDDASFDGLLCRGDELVAMLAPSRDRGLRILDATARDSANPINRRANALYLLYHCDNEQIKEVSEALQGDNELRDVVNHILSRNA
ncbi:MAG TPA: DUF4365 domain-containing protein [Thermoanaerobaculia bacterium]|nr:DUF4365 domain-containing protein [Thermoanaerobaculia bacterium]